jgi:hypothetical protein
MPVMNTRRTPGPWPSAPSSAASRPARPGPGCRRLPARMGQEGRQRAHMISPVSASGGAGRRPPTARLCDGDRQLATGSATASLPKPSWVTKLSAALTSSSRFSMRSAFLLGLVEVDQAAERQHQFDDLAQRQALRVARAAHRSGHEALQVGAALPTTAPTLWPGCAAGARGVLQLLDAARADAARGEVHHPQEAGVVVGFSIRRR